MRGEHRTLARSSSTSAGSSPRARGAPADGDAAAAVRGIIPACAGSTRVSHESSASKRDHPRVRGEHVSGGSSRPQRGGSSPRARGAHAAAGVLRGLPGIIPACAGSTSPTRLEVHDAGDHPRVRGEHSISRPMNSGQLGSSPRARGALYRRNNPPSAYGIIPACAGSTSQDHRSAPGLRDHPRVRGEHRFPAHEHYVEPGSSPRARGAPNAFCVLCTTTGIIPACAGSTSPGPVPGSVRKDHPRVRGEH